MASTLGETFVNVGLNTAPFKAGIAAMKSAAMGLGATIATALGPVAVAFAGAFAVKEIVSGFIEGEQASKGLAAALATNGQEVEKNMKGFEALAGELQKMTRVDDEEMFGMFKQGLNLGLPADALKDATKSAIGLGTALDIDHSSAMQALSKEMLGVKSNLDRQIPALKGVTDQTQRLAIISDFAGKGFVQEGEMVNTLGGQLDQLWNAVGNLAESIGSLLAPAIGFAVDVCALLVSVAQQAPWAEWAEAIPGVAASFGFVKTAILEIIYALFSMDLQFELVATVVADFWDNFGSWVDFAWENFKAFNSWIIENFGNTLKNMGEHLVNLFTNPFDAIEKGMKDPFWVLTKGASDFKGVAYKPKIDYSGVYADLDKRMAERRKDFDILVKDAFGNENNNGKEPIKLKVVQESKEKETKAAFNALGTAFFKANEDADKAIMNNTKKAADMLEKLVNRRDPNLGIRFRQ